MQNTQISDALYKRACVRLPGGVNSPVRAFGSVGMTPRFIERADGAYMWDADGNRYMDFVGSWGPMVLGHNYPAIREAVEKAVKDGLSFGAATAREVEIAELIHEMVPSVEMLRMVNSGTEAVMSAIRAARGFTGRSKIIKFTGCYHGHSDSLLVAAGSGVMTQGIPDSAGVPAGCTQDTLSANYNNLESVKVLFEANPDQIAAVIVEPVAANMGVVLPEEGFLQGLRDLCDQNGSLLIFDEVITGFRLSAGGAQEYFGIRPDLTTFGKIIGGGMPVGAYGGRSEIMKMVSPLGPVYQAGTLSGNPVAMAAGLAALTTLKEDKEFYVNLNAKADRFFEAVRKNAADDGVGVYINHIGSLGSIFFTDTPVRDYTSAKTSDTEKFSAYFRVLLEDGIYIGPSQFEAMFISGAHTDEELAFTAETIRKAWQTEY